MRRGYLGKEQKKYMKKKKKVKKLQKILYLFPTE